MVLRRKRPRQPPRCSVVEECSNDSDGLITTHPIEPRTRCDCDASPPTWVKVSSTKRRRRRHRRPPRLAASPAWKIAFTTLLLWIYDNVSLSFHINGLLPVVDAWGGGNNNNNSTKTTKKGLQLVGTCSQEDFQVNAVYLVCDSPGAYYRGSSTYRDSATCLYGDKARLQLEFAIKDSFTGASSIRLEIESGIYDQWKRVAILDDLCSYSGSSLQRVYSEYESMSSCPTPGLYQMDTYFTVPAFTEDSELHYTPDLRFRFYNAKGSILGCATTGTLALSGYARQHAQQGLFALMGAFFALICLFASLIYLNYGRERRMLAEKRELKMQRSMSGVPRPVVTTAQDAVDHEQRYHYFNGNEQGLNGSSHTSNTSNAGSSLSSHHPRKHPPL